MHVNQITQWTQCFVSVSFFDFHRTYTHTVFAFFHAASISTCHLHRASRFAVRDICRAPYATQGYMFAAGWNGGVQTQKKTNLICIIIINFLWNSIIFARFHPFFFNLVDRRIFFRQFYLTASISNPSYPFNSIKQNKSIELTRLCFLIRILHCLLIQLQSNSDLLLSIAQLTHQPTTHTKLSGTKRYKQKW